MKKDKGKMPADQYREPQIEEEMSDSGDPKPQRQAKKTEPPVTGYGLYHARGSDGEPTERRCKPRIIEEPGLVYNGTNFTQCLARYKQAALAFQALDYEKTLQIGQFVHKEELKLELEAMVGYDSFKQGNERELGGIGQHYSLYYSGFGQNCGRILQKRRTEGLQSTCVTQILWFQTKENGAIIFGLEPKGSQSWVPQLTRFPKTKSL
jgi:hypothetical protein